MFWCGDFNYRIDLTYEEVFYFVKRQDWKRLLEFDQLQLQKSSGKVSCAFEMVFNTCSNVECACMHSVLLPSSPTLCDPINCSPPGSSVHGILQAGILEWVAIPFSRGSSDPGIEPASLLYPALADRFFTTSATWEPPVWNIVY